MIRKTIRLPQAQAASIDEAITRGAYRNQSAVIRAALRLWQRAEEEKRLHHVWPSLVAGPQGELNTQSLLLQARGRKT